jgi:hypothetical protein
MPFKVHRTGSHPRVSYQALHTHCTCGHELGLHDDIKASPEPFLIITGACQADRCDCVHFITPRPQPTTP